MNPSDNIAKEVELIERELSKAKRSQGVFCSSGAIKQKEDLLAKYTKALKLLLASGL